VLLLLLLLLPAITSYTQEPKVNEVQRLVRRVQISIIDQSLSDFGHPALFTPTAAALKDGSQKGAEEARGDPGAS
jgi:hypothetical protein